MALVFWSGNGQNRSQVDTYTVTAAGVGGTLTLTINAKSIIYTCVTGDTTTTAAAGLVALLTASDAPPEFGEIDWSNSANVITATAATPGMPFTVTKSDAGGATSTLTTTTANLSASDVNDPDNWLRAGVAAIPQNGDDVILQDSDIPLLYNLTALAAVQFASFQRWQSFTGQVGLPTWNPSGYREYRPTYFQFIGGSLFTTLALTLGIGTGDGPSLERYDTQNQRVDILCQNGAVVDWKGIYYTSTDGTNIRLQGATLNVAMEPGQVAAFDDALVDGGGTLNLGQGVTADGTITANAGALNLYCAGSVVASNGSTVSVSSRGATHVVMTARGGTTVAWLSNSTITTLTLESGSVLNKSQDPRTMTITNSNVQGDCQVLDPMSLITWTTATVVTGQVTSGPFQFAGTRTVRII